MVYLWVCKVVCLCFPCHDYSYRVPRDQATQSASTGHGEQMESIGLEDAVTTHNGQETEDMKKHAIEATAQIKQAMLKEHETNQALEAQIGKLQEELRDTQDRLSTSQRAEERSREALKEAETSLGRKDAEELAARIHQGKALQESQQRATALSRECEALRHQVESVTRQLRQVQETLAAREYQHREELRNHYTLDSPELKELLDKKVKAVERSFQADLVKQQEKAEKLGQQYNELENEFRYALHTEEARFLEAFRPPSVQEAGDGARTPDRRVPANLRADSPSNMPPTPQKKNEEEEKEEAKKKKKINNKNHNNLQQQQQKKEEEDLCCFYEDFLMNI
ncbi:leucine-rich repeat and coiled-coil domain-containing protein 1-like [Plakobranchus ocellatus]|uniref:Leucine-rich repeat and coiled-coil domain-containing protein 1-like n=1 Tax=Plakobranchus ocellatus TaxID=259542 RepID=A0AAV4C0V7_9GAST|nr:leucine-rich repeat and coiled-coil domain-containing protein 1-like [Plakobranchus ocellatus]